MPSEPRKSGNDPLHLRPVATVGEMRAPLHHVNARPGNRLGKPLRHAHGGKAVLGARDDLHGTADARAVREPVAALEGLVEQREERRDRVVAQARRHLRIARGPRLEPREGVLAHPEPHVRVEVFVEAPRSTSGRWAAHHALSAGGAGYGGPLIDTTPPHAGGRVDRRPQGQRPAHGRPAPHRALDPEGVEPEHEVFGLLRIRIVRGPLELGGETVAAGVREEGADPAEERLEVRDHGRGVLDRASVDPDHRRPGGVASLAPVEANAVGQSDLRQGSGAAPRAARSGTWSTCRPSTPPR